MADAIARLRRIATLAAEAERNGYSATIRLVPAGFSVQVSRNFRTRSALITFEDVALRGDDIFPEVFARMVRDCPLTAWETGAADFLSTTEREKCQNA